MLSVGSCVALAEAARRDWICPDLNRLSQALMATFEQRSERSQSRPARLPGTITDADIVGIGTDDRPFGSTRGTGSEAPSFVRKQRYEPRAMTGSGHLACGTLPRVFEPATQAISTKPRGATT
jgi:hypothetical protein